MAARASVLLPVLTVACGGSPTPAPSPPPPATTGSAPTDAESGPDDGPDRYLADLAETLGYSLGEPFGVSVTPDGDEILFLRSGPRDMVSSLYGYAPATGAERVIVRPDDLQTSSGEHLSAEERARRERARQVMHGIVDYQMSDDGSRLLVPYSGKLYLVARDDGAVTEVGPETGYALAPQLSPDGERIGFLRDGDMIVLDAATGEERALFASDEPTTSYGEAEFVAQEEMLRRQGFWWSPDGRFVAVQKTDESPVETLYIADPQNPSQAPRESRYPRAGTDNAIVELAVVPATGGEPVWIDWDREAFPYLFQVVWEENAPLTIVVEDRRQTEARVLAVDPATGDTRLLHTERDEVWVDPGLFAKYPVWLEDGSGFLWRTDRNGRAELELRGPDGDRLRSLTPEGLSVGGVLHVDEEAGTAIVRATESQPERHLYEVTLSGERAPRRLTEEAGQHGATFARDDETHVRTSSTLSGARQTTVYAEGQRVGELTSRAEEPPHLPELELARVDTGERVLNAAIVRPRDFTAGRRYPVLVSVYGGPGSQMVRATPRSYLRSQWFADQGFIVVALDGRGTPHRGREWERAIRGAPARVPIADQAAGLAALGERYPELDLDRVGIYGWSYGGYAAAMAVLLRPDVFHAAVAGAPVTDWRNYDTHYTERYLGLPDENPEVYRRSSAVERAGDLERPLMLVHGTVDDNVLLVHTLELSDALFRAGKRHELLILSGLTHMVPDATVTTRLARAQRDFFRRHLAGDRITRP